MQLLVTLIDLPCISNVRCTKQALSILNIKTAENMSLTLCLLLILGNPVTRDFEVFEHIASGGPGMSYSKDQLQLPDSLSILHD
jgi:hypothetical protein